MFRVLLLISLLLITPNGFSKEQEDKPTLGSVLLLIDTSYALEDTLRQVKSFSKEMDYLYPGEKRLLYAYANYKLGKYREADRILKKSIADDNLSIITDYLFFFRADMAMKNKNYNEALVLYSNLLEEYSESTLAGKAKLGLADALIGLKRYKEARFYIESCLTGRCSDNGSLEAYLLNVESFAQEGDCNRARIELQDLVVSIGRKNQLEKILERADKLESSCRRDFSIWLKDPVSKYRIAEAFARNSQWDDAMEYVRDVLKNDSASTALKEDAKWLYANASFRTHRYSEAIKTIEELLETVADKEKRLDFLKRLAAAYTRLDDYSKAIETWQRILDQYPKNRDARLSARFNIGQLLIDDGKFGEALITWKDFLKHNSGSKYANKALWYIAWSYYRLGDYDSSISVISKLLAKGRSIRDFHDRLIYWKARALEEKGEYEKASNLYAGVYEEYPFGYYGFLAKRKLEGDAGSAARGLPQSSWYPDYPSREVLSSSTHLAKAVFFDRLKLHEYAAREAEAALPELKGENADLLLWLGSRNFAHNIAYNIVSKYYSVFLRDIPYSAGFDRFVWEQAYPEAYRTIVEPLCSGKVDSNLVYAIMRAESLFRPQIVSPAGAIGLMQLMPSTAERISKTLGEGKFQTQSLYNPPKNIEYGIEYLKMLNNLFPENIAAVIASYNAGEDAVKRWLRHGSSNDIEEFVEEIPYSETNAYVKKVLKFYWILQQIYS